VTVCIAALCNGANTVIGAADRMLTAGDIEFEPPQTKLLNLTSSITALVAGDARLQIEVLYKVREAVNERVRAEPTNWLPVEEVALMYVHQYASVRRQRAENKILTPLGLDSMSFINNQQRMSAQLVDKLAAELLNFDVSATATIFAGVDPTGAHIYTLQNGTLSCDDVVGFSAIGAGALHADSQMMFGSHAKWSNFADTLLLTYSAKKRSEVAPGVGAATDMFYIGPQVGSYVEIGDHVLSRLDKIYKEEQKRQARARQKSREKTNEYIEELNRASTPKDQGEVPKDARRTETADAGVAAPGQPAAPEESERSNAEKN
jgi:hypothetical protein